MRRLFILLCCSVLTACTTTSGTAPQPAKLNLSAAAPEVPPDIRAKYGYSVPAPSSPLNTLPQNETYKLIRDLKLSETEKIQFLRRLIQIIDSSRSLLSSPASSKDLAKLLQQAQQKAAQKSGALQ